MKDTALFFLHQIAEKHPENQFAKAIFNRFNEAGDEVDYKSWQLLDTNLDNVAQLGNYEPFWIKKKQEDFRFLYLYLRAVRKFPPLLENYYGISFGHKEKDLFVPESTLLQGRNGTGKTSLFDALEYLFTKNVSAATKMGFSTIEEQKDYLCYAGSPFNDVNIGVITPSSDFTLLPLEKLPQNDIRRLCLLPFFCSEYDVDKLIGGEDLGNFVYEQMGYGLVKWVIDKVYEEITTAVSQHEAAVSQHEEISDTSGNIRPRPTDLDKKIEMYANLRTSFLYLVIGLDKEETPWDSLEKLKKHLSKELQMDNDDDHRQLTEEKKELERIMGEKAKSYLLQQYSMVEQIVLKATEQETPIELDNLESLFKTQRNIIEENKAMWTELNYARKSFHQALIDFIDVNDPYDYSSYIRKYDNSEQEFKRESEKREKELVTYNKYIKNKATYDQFLEALKDEVYGAIEKNTTAAREMINEIMNLFVMEDEKMQFSFNKNDGTFSMGITLSDSNGKTLASFTPEEYLNTFRYKLYCMSLKMAIAFAMKQFYKMNFPIVIDDIFHSSDFTHRSMVRTYFRILFKKHKNLFPELKDELQVIFLSHDEVIIEAASRGIRDARVNANRQMLFDYRVAEDEKSVHTNNGQTIKIISLTCSL